MNKQEKINNEKASEIRPPKNWVEMESPNFIRFDNIGDLIEGILTKVEKSNKYGFGLYTITTYEGEQKRFHGSNQIDDMLLNIDVPCHIRIEYTDTQETGSGTMKVFKVSRGEN